MAKHSLLLVDADPQSLRVLEVSLRKAGYSVVTSSDAQEALRALEAAVPDLILIDPLLPGMDGFALVAAMRVRSLAADLPVLFLASDGSVEQRVRALSLGVEDFVAKPLYIRDILARVELVLQRRARDGMCGDHEHRVKGSLADMGLVDLLQTIDVSRKSGVLHLQSRGRSGSVFFSEGRVLAADCGALRGEHALYRFLLWNEGQFELDFREVRREGQLSASTQGLLMEGMRRLDAWGALLEELPPLTSVLEVNGQELADRIAEIPDELNQVLQLFDGTRTVEAVIDHAAGDDLATLTAIGKLYRDKFLAVCAIDPFEVLLARGSSPLALRPSDAHEPQQESNAPRRADERPSLAGAPGPGELPSRTARPDDSSSSMPLGSASVRVAGVQLRRVSVAAHETRVERVLSTETLKKPSNSGDLQGARTGSAAPEEGDPAMAKHWKRKPSRPPSALQSEGAAGTDSNNVIKLPMARIELNESRRPSDATDKLGMAADGPRPAHRTKRDNDPEAVVPARSVDAREELPEPRSEAAGTQSGAARVAGPGTRSEPRASTPVDQEDDHPEINRFFEASTAAGTAAREQWDDLGRGGHDEHEHEHAHRSQRGKLWSVGIGLLGATLIGAFLVYHKVLMPTPEDLIAGPVALPTPDMMQAVPALDEPAGLGTSAAPAVEIPAQAEPPAQQPAELAPAPSTAAAADPSVVEAAEPSARAKDVPALVAPEVAAPSAGAAPTGNAAPVEALAPSAALGSDSPAYRSALAAARKLGFRKTAEVAYLKALSIAPEGAEALSGMAMLALNQGKYPAAREHAEAALRSDPANSEALIVLGAALSAQGKAGQAREAYARCAALPDGKYVAECKRMLR